MKRWQLVQDLFAETSELDATERARVLRERAGPDEALIHEVEALVAADAEPSELFERTAAELLQELADAPPAEDLCGERFGSYTVEAHLSSGGMGHVYRAIRTSAGIERRVALKVLRHGLDTRAFLARFQRERTALASLEHEHIVRFLDADALPDGRPYLVMEYVDGVPITAWGEAHVDVRENIELFLQVLAAVQYAHQKLVIHRDLKPSNILVSAQGVPKLLDFGVATILDAKREPAQGDGAPEPLTPGYASPEQLRGDTVTTASDVYSLGVILRELLAQSAVAEDGDLQAIIARALEQDPDRRYPSADRLADDLRRYLTGEPVSARQATWMYRASCFVRRHPWPLASAAAVLLALAAGWIGSDLNRRRAEAESSVGWGAHAQAKLAARVLENAIASATKDTDAVQRRAVASQLEQALLEDVPANSESEALVRLTLARLYVVGNEPGAARVHLDRALDLCRSVRGLGPSELARAEELRARIAEETEPE